MPTIQTAVTKFWSVYFPAFLISLLLAGCSGGGGGGSGGGTTTDTTAPTVSSTSPASNATSVAINTTVSATFSEAMNAASITTSTFTLKTTSGAAAVSGTVALSGNTATFTPAVALDYGTSYTATLTTGMQDAAGNALAAVSTWMFTTIAAPDTTPPTVSSHYPEISTGVALNTSIAATFSEAMNATTINTTTFTLAMTGGASVSGTVVLSGNTATFTPAADLVASTSYTVTVTTGVQDAAGNALSANHTWSFTTGATSDNTAPTVSSTTPLDSATDVAVGTTVTATFSEVMKASTITSTTFTLVATGGASVTGAVTLAGNVATLTPNTALTGLTNYTATITGAQDAAGNALATTSWSFTTLDNIPPTVTARTPASGATGIGVNTTVTATFSEAMNPTTINTMTFTVGGVTGTVALSGNTATFTPNANLTGLTTYTATITTGAQDTAANALAANHTWSFTTAAAPTFNISGTVNGPYVSGMTITMSGGASDTAMTDANGAYSFATPRLAGSYTLTPSVVPGYTIPAQTVTITNANVVQDFTATSTVPSYSISGTVTSSSSKTGRTRIQVFNTGCTDCSPVAGISIASPGTGAYTIRGLQDGSYTVRASMGYLGTGAANATNPSGSASVTISSGNQSNIDITIADPALQTADTPTGLQMFPANGSALILWDPVENDNRTEKVTAYKIYWGTDTAASTGGGSVVVGARGDAFYLQSGLTDSTSYYYKIASCVSDDLLCTIGEGTASTVEGPVTIGATSGSNTVTGAVTFPGTAAGLLWVVVYNTNTGSIQFNRIANPVSPQNYSIAGVPSGTLGAYILLDTNSNGYHDLGELSFESSESSDFTVSGNTTKNFTLSSAGANATVGTRTFYDGTNTSYNLNLEVREGTKRPVNVTLLSGLNVALPLDMGKDWGSFRAYPGINATPAVGQTYVFKVTYSNNTTEILSSSVTGVLGLSAMAQNLSAIAGGSGPSNSTPLFGWTVPTSPPAVTYTYSVYVSAASGGGTMWETDNRLPSSTTSVLYNADNTASSASLTPGTLYNWQVTVQDANGNEATRQTTYTP